MSKKLYRSRSKRMVAGICGGIGEYADIDPTIIRLALVVFVFVGFSGVLAYLVAWLVIPEEPAFIEKPSEGKGNSSEMSLFPRVQGEDDKDFIDEDVVEATAATHEVMDEEDFPVKD